MQILAAALLAATISSAVPLSKDPFGPAAFAQTEPRVAASPHGSFIVWRDGRVNEYSTVATETYGSRLDREGRVLDPLGIRLFHRGYERVRVVWTGADYLVSAEGLERIIARHVSVDGTPGKTFTLLPSTPGFTFEGIASNGRTILVLRQAWKGGERGALTATLLDAGGSLRKTIRLGNGTSLVGAPRVVDGSFVATLAQSANVRVVRIRDNGRMSSKRVRGVPESRVLTSSITPTGDVLLVIARSAGPVRLGAGSVDAKSGVVRAFHDVGETQFSPQSVAASWDGATHVMCWSQYRGSNEKIRALRLDRDAQPIGPAVTLGQTPGADVHVDSGIVVWSGRGSPYFDDIYAAELGRDPVLVSKSGTSQNAVAIASDGERIFAATQIGESPRRILAGLAPFDENVTEIGGKIASWPGVAWLGDRYVVTWTDGNLTPEQRLMARLFDRDGKPLGEAIAIDQQFSGAEEAPFATSNGATVMIAWSCGSHAPIFQLDRDLRILGRTSAHAAGFPVASLVLATVPPPVQPLSSPRVVWDGTSWIAAWVDRAGVHFARVTHAMRLEPLSDVPQQASWLAVSAWNGQIFAAWNDLTCLRSGVVGSKETSTIDCGGSSVVGFAGDLLVWRNGRGELVAKQFPDGETFVIAADAAWASLAETTEGVVVAYLHASDTDGGVRRVFMRTIKR